MSIRTRSGLMAWAFLMASAPSSASATTSKPDSFSRRLAKPFLKRWWSSASNNRMVSIGIMFRQGQLNRHSRSTPRGAADTQPSTHRLGPIFHSLKAKMKAWFWAFTFTESLSIIFYGYSGGVIVTFDRDFTSGRARVFNDIRQGLMDDSDQLNFNLRGESNDFRMIHSEIHGNFSHFAEVLEKISESSDEPHVIPRSQGTQTEDGFAKILIGFVNDRKQFIQ